MCIKSITEKGRDGMIGSRIKKDNLIKTLFITTILIFSGIVGVVGIFEVDNRSDNYNYNQESIATSDLPDMAHNGARGNPRATVDVGVVGVSDIDAVNFIDHFPGKVVHMNVSIQNFGDSDITEPFDILMTVSDGSSRYPSYTYQENKTIPYALGKSVLKANAPHQNLSWNWTPPLSMPHGAEFNFSISDISFRVCFTTLLEGDQNSVNNQLCLMVKVDKPDFNIELEPGWTINKIYFPQEPFHVVPKKGQTNQFELNFTLYNFGEATYINFTVQAPPDWKAIPPPRQFWQSRSNSSSPAQNLSITVFPSIRLQNLPTATTLNIKLTAIAESFPLERDTLVFKGDVSFVPFPNIIPPKVPEGMDVYYITPGEAYIDFKVQNQGNGEDNFKCWAQVGERKVGRDRLLRDGWRAVVHSGTKTRILSRGESQIVTVKVIVPSKVRAGSPAGITLFAQSIKDPSHIDGTKNKTTYIFADLFKEVSFDLTETLTTLSMLPNDDISTLLRIRNTGNKADKTISVNVSSKPEDWEVIIDSSDIPGNGLQRNGTAEIEIIIKTPRYVVESLYDIKLSAISDNQIKDEITLQVQILKVRHIALSCKDSRKTGKVSEKISYLITVENNGNTKDSIDLRHSFVTPDMKEMGWKIVMSKNFTTLYPYESRDVVVSVFIPLEALADTEFITAHLDGYRVLIRGISQNDTSVVADKEIEIVVEAIYKFSFNKEKDKRYMILHNTQNVYYSFSMTNEGNIMDIYDLGLDTTPANKEWVSIPYIERRLRPGVTEKLYIELEPPSHLSAGNYEFEIFATSRNIPTLKQQLNLTIEIIEFDLAIKSIYIGDILLKDAEIDEGETVLLRAELENIGDLDYYNKTIEQLVGKEKGLSLIIKFTEGRNYIGETNVTYLPSKLSNDNNSIFVGIPWKIGKARDYEITVEIDPNGDIPESKTLNNKIKGTLSVGSKEGKDEKDEGASAGDLALLLILIIIFMIIMIVGIWMTLNISKQKLKKGYTVDGEYKPYEETDKAEFDKDDEEEEPEGGVLGIQDERPYGAKKKDKFLTDLSTILTMKSIRRTKPIRRSKPLTSLIGEGKPAGLGRPRIAGYLPPKSEKETKPTDAKAPTSKSTESPPPGGKS